MTSTASTRSSRAAERRTCRLGWRGARPVGIDISERQLATARTLQEEFGLEFPLVQGNAEPTPFDDESFDFAISEYGASIWCDPYGWIPEPRGSCARAAGSCPRQLAAVDHVHG